MENGGSFRGTWGRMHEFYEIQCNNGIYYVGVEDI
jgi:hypothetical protein